MKKIIGIGKKIFWRLPIPSLYKESLRFRYATAKDKREVDDSNILVNNKSDVTLFVKNVLETPTKISDEYCVYQPLQQTDSDVHLIAYYLTQYHPTIKNDEWWGKGTTEWTNVSKAVPQYAEHYQPRLPGELGFYDLRVKENMLRQFELAKNYGIDVFCFYYYWFEGERLLEQPLNMFCNDPSMQMQYCICWANENWTKRFSGTNTDILMKVGDSEQSYIEFIYDALHMFEDKRYFCVDSKPVLIIYRPALVINTTKVLQKWREIVKSKIGKELHIIAVQEKGDNRNWCAEGYDAETEFQPKRINTEAKEITSQINFIRKDFGGNIYDYKDLVENKKYRIKRNLNKKVYRAVMPMWDNTARRNNKAVVYHGATPSLYKSWLEDTIDDTRKNKKIDDNIIFINAWNEWGEGAYLEPDRYYGYAFLQATYEAKKRDGNDIKETK